MLRSRRKRSVIGPLALSFVLSCEAPAWAQDGEPQDRSAARTLLLEVLVNGASLNEIARFVQDGDRLRIPGAQFSNLALLAPPQSTELIDGEMWVWLDRVPGLAWSVDGPGQRIDLHPAFSTFRPTVLPVSPRRTRVAVQGDYGALASWDVFAQWAPEDDLDVFPRNIAIHTDTRIFSPRMTAVSRGVIESVAGEDTRFVRLESHADFDSLGGSWRVRLGDSYTRGPRWGRPLRFGGVHWSREFSIRPDLVTAPAPVLESEVATPSSIDVFVNGVQRYSRSVGPGVVQLSDLPILTGSNTIQAVITDRYGQRTEVALPFYAADTLLVRGTSDFSLEGGRVRENYGLASDDYGAAFLSGFYAHGLNDRVTIRGQSSIADDYWSASAGFTAALRDFAVLEGAVLHSQSARESGWGVFAAVSRSTPTYNVAVTHMRADEYTDLAGWLEQDRLTEQTTAMFGVNLDRLGQFHLLYASQANDKARRSSIVSGSWSIELDTARQVQFGVSGFTDTENGAWGGFLSLSMPFGERSHAFVQHGWRDGRPGSDINIQHSAYDNRMHLQFNAAAGAGRGTETDASATWADENIDLRLRAIRAHGATGVQAEMAQSLVWMNGGLFLSSRIDDAFAVVEVPGSPGVEVALENRPVGRTDKSGRLLITGLQSYLGNAISIDPLDLPIDVAVATTSMLLAPREQAGAVARFEIDRALSAIVVVEGSDGAAPPAGARVSLRGSEDIRPLGFGGEAYVRGLQPGQNVLDIQWRNGGCSVTFVIEQIPAGVPRLGPYPCVAAL